MNVKLLTLYVWMTYRFVKSPLTYLNSEFLRVHFLGNRQRTTSSK